MSCKIWTIIGRGVNSFHVPVDVEADRNLVVAVIPKQALVGLRDDDHASTRSVVGAAWNT